MDASLKTWQLIPSTTPSALWSLSTFTTTVYVRAEGPREARELAAEYFRKYAAPQSDAGKLCSPWLDPDLVYCVEAAGESFCMLPSPRALMDVEASGFVPTFDGSVPMLNPPTDGPARPITSANWSDLVRMTKGSK